MNPWITPNRSARITRQFRPALLTLAALMTPPTPPELDVDDLGGIPVAEWDTMWSVATGGQDGS